MQLILASSSKPRQQLLQRLQIPFEIAHPNIDETPRSNESPQELVLRLSEEKARIVAKLFPEALIIAADQVGVLNQQIQGKPHTYENALNQLRQASGQWMRFFVGLCLLNAKTQFIQTSLEEFDVLYRKLTDEMIKKYLLKEQPLECAGSCKAEGLGIVLIEEFRGTDPSTLIGLPLIRLVKMLERADLNPLS